MPPGRPAWTASDATAQRFRIATTLACIQGASCMVSYSHSECMPSTFVPPGGTLPRGSMDRPDVGPGLLTDRLNGSADREHARRSQARAPTPTPTPSTDAGADVRAIAPQTNCRRRRQRSYRRSDADRDVNSDAHRTLGRPLPDSYPTLPVLVTDVAIASN
jgi:hypothetical protein